MVLLSLAAWEDLIKTLQLADEDVRSSPVWFLPHYTSPWHLLNSSILPQRAWSQAQHLQRVCWGLFCSGFSKDLVGKLERQSSRHSCSLAFTAFFLCFRERSE